MEWTQEQRYEKLEDASPQRLADLKQQVSSCPWRQRYHIQPETGLLNDPNGFVFYQGQYHLFYQWFPLGPVHGVKYWYHMTSADLIHWQGHGPAIKPDQTYDSHGAFSGSGFEKDGELYLMYTGNHRDENWNRVPTQALAKVTGNGRVSKYPNPVIDNVPPGYTDHFRDPKVWREDDAFYCVIGAQRTDLTGCAVLYRSADLHSWDFLGELPTSYRDFGYMWECPDFFQLDGRDILVISPQGIEASGNQYQNIFQSGCLIGNETLDLQTFEWSHQGFQELDRGFDFYAPQTTMDASGRRIMIGWMGLPDIEYPTAQNGWVSTLTLPRELSLKDGKLIQAPIAELEQLRRNAVTKTYSLHQERERFGRGKHYELVCRIKKPTDVTGLDLRVGAGEKVSFYWDPAARELVLDRSASGAVPARDFGTSRKTAYLGEELEVRIFMDTSSIEIFVNGGQEVFTSRIFPTNSENGIEVFTAGTAQLELTQYNY